MYALLTFRCIACNNLAAGNPHTVPSIRAKRSPDGKLITDPSYPREPICQNCMEAANAVRVEMGLEPHPIAPDAYQAADEKEI